MQIWGGSGTGVTQFITFLSHQPANEFQIAADVDGNRNIRTISKDFVNTKIQKYHI